MHFSGLSGMNTSVTELQLKKSAHCFFTCGMSSLLPHVVVQGEYTEDKKVIIFLKEKGGKR